MYERVLEITFGVFIIYVILCLIKYFPRFKAWFGAFKPQQRIYGEKKHKIALIVPARNESMVIGQLFKSLESQTYSNNYFDVHVIIKEKNDKTVDICQNVSNAFVHIVENQTCKGDALDACLKKILNETPNLYDGYLIIDADCTLENTCLEEFNNALSTGKQVIQAKKLVKNYLYKEKGAYSLSSCCNGLIWTIIDELGNRYKTQHNITNMTIGTGILIRHDVIKLLGGWPYRQTLTEDIEFMNDCALRKISTYYYSYAKIYVEEALSLKVTNKRRTRWLTGVVDSKRLYISRLKAELSDTKEDRKNKYFVTALTPVYYLIGGCTLFGLYFLITSLVMFICKNPLWLECLLYGGVAFGIIYVSFWLLTLACIIIDYKNIKLPFYKKIILLFAHPIFYMGYIPIISKALLGINRGWEVIERVNLESLN